MGGAAQSSAILGDQQNQLSYLLLPSYAQPGKRIPLPPHRNILGMEPGILASPVRSAGALNSWHRTSVRSLFVLTVSIRGRAERLRPVHADCRVVWAPVCSESPSSEQPRLRLDGSLFRLTPVSQRASSPPDE